MTLQEATLLHGRAALKADRAWVSADAAGNLLADAGGAASVTDTAGVLGTGGSGSEMGDVLWDWMAGADAGDADIRGFAGFAEGVVARVKVFALLCGGKREAVSGGYAGTRLFWV